ncbi:MAG: sigma-70 family RNA polymerase sigma factor [Bacteroidales bacterium]|nr:sigma-70 family RNA polymerase sigma factor [Lentimicrobiaceae bacterium]MDD5694190.1 sigma-70 family RNA polymerase sigma factor [Bacteroidales bacterium]
MLRYSDEEILGGLVRKDSRIIKFILVEHFATIKRFILRNNGTPEDAEDVFQEAMMIIYQKTKDNELSLECSFITFLYSVSRHIWFQKLEKNRIDPAYVSDLENFIQLSDEMRFEVYDEEKERIRLFQKHFLALGEDCQKLLRLFVKRVPLAEIMKIMGYKSVKYAKTRKFLCKEKLKKNIRNDPGSHKFYAQ